MSARMKVLVSRTAPGALALAALLLLAPTSFAAPIVWSTEAGGNGHSYGFVRLYNNESWSESSDMAEATTLEDGSLGYLATITSAEEQAFIQNAVLPTFGVNKNQVWIGGQQDAEPVDGTSGAPLTPSAGWKWIVNTSVAPESWSYTNWLSENEPSNEGNIDERFLTMWVHYYNSGVDLRGRWNDEDDVAPSTAVIIGMIVEWSPASVPEPATAALSALGLGLLALRLRRR
jgi:hypothetical protein